MVSDSRSDKAVLFDLDGTLLDTVPLIVETYEHIFKRFLGHSGDRTEILASIGTPLETIFEQYEADLASEMMAAFIDYNRQRLSTHVGVFRQVPAILQMLKDAGIPMAVVTSKRMYSTRINLDDFNLARWFKAVAARESTMRHKPDPAPVFEAMRQLELADPAKIVFVGDSVHDLACARNAGVHSAIVDWTAMPQDELREQTPDLWIKTADQLLDYIGNL